MNLFYLNRDPQLCAAQHCDKHVVKMIVEYAQLLSTAHRVIDGTMFIDKTDTGRNVKRWTGDDRLYLASHVNHPAGIWCRASSANYNFLYELFAALCKEYTRRYGKVHSTETKCDEVLRQLPKKIPQGGFWDPPLSMPDEYKVDDAVISYQNLYVGSKARFAVWSNRQPPDWFIQRTDNYDEAHFTRTR